MCQGNRLNGMKLCQSPTSRIAAWRLQLPGTEVLFMKKENMVFALAGIVIGIIAGVLIANQGATRMQTAQPAQVVSAPSAPVEQQQQPAEQQQLPKGHPPIDNGTLEREIAAQQEILKRDPGNQNATVAIANLYYDAKNAKEAVKWYEKAVAKDPQNINLNTDLGTSYLQMQDFDKAMEYYNKSLLINPKHYQTLMNMGIARMAMGDKKGAAETWEKLVTFYPNDPNTQMIKNALQEMRGKQGG
jgi:Tfp pilus assembly protein PilF